MYRVVDKESEEKEMGNGMLLKNRSVFLTGRVDERGDKVYCSASFENNDTIVEVNADEHLAGVIPGLKKYREYECTFTYEKVVTPTKAFTVFKLVDIQPVSSDK